MADDGLPSIASVIRREGLAALKSLGQNFLLDLSLTRRIVRTAARPLGTVVEIGPGPGALTRALLMEGADHVFAIERDPRCRSALQEVADHYPGRLTVVEGDALAIDPRDHLGTDRLQAPQIVANLPYNIGTELLVRWLRGADAEERNGALWWRRATIMLQREVAERIVAVPGGKSYGRLAVLAHRRADAHIRFDVSQKAFSPPPKVVSSVVSLTPLAQPRFDAPLELLEKVTAAAFSQRRKMLRSSLKSLSAESDAWIRAAGLDPTTRAENVTPEAFARLASLLQ